MLSARDIDDYVRPVRVFLNKNKTLSRAFKDDVVAEAKSCIRNAADRRENIALAEFARKEMCETVDVLKLRKMAYRRLYGERRR